MIISASRRTDIPAYYSEWFLNRIEERYVLVRNPMNSHQISCIDLSPDVVDGIVFWTKNPAPMLERLDRLKDYMYYFQFTLNAYGKDIERNVPSKNKIIIPAFQKLADIIGPERVIWRYDPIFYTDKYTLEYHTFYFEKLARCLAPYTKKCTISFLDLYQSIKKEMAANAIRQLTVEQQKEIAERFAEIADRYGLILETCAESIDLSRYKIEHARCIDNRIFEKLLGCHLSYGKDKNQRLECGCMESIDIGAYDTCRNGCCYCYAVKSKSKVCRNAETHNPAAPVLAGEIGIHDKITKRKMSSCILKQSTFNFEI